MRITSVRTVCFAQPMIPIHVSTFPGELELVLVVVGCDAGVEGVSIARTHGGQRGSTIAGPVEVSLAPLAIGMDPRDPAAVWARTTALEPAGYVSTFAIAALDVAVWDLAGKLAGTTVAALCGGRRTSMQAYASSTHHRTIDGYVADLQRARERGYAAYKAHPFYDPVRDVALARALREAAGPSMRLMLDAAKRYSRADALRVGEALQSLGFHWFEEPLPQHDWAGYAALRRALEIPVIGGETLPGLHPAIANALEAGAWDAVLCDAYWKGGITGLLRTIEVCAARGVPVASHHGASALMNLANLHVLCGATDVDMIEVLVPEAAYEYGLRSYPRLAADGRLHLPPGPGLGGEPDWAYVEAHRRG